MRAHGQDTRSFLLLRHPCEQTSVAPARNLDTHQLRAQKKQSTASLFLPSCMGNHWPCGVWRCTPQTDSPTRTSFFFINFFSPPPTKRLLSCVQRHNRLARPPPPQQQPSHAPRKTLPQQEKTIQSLAVGPACDHKRSCRRGVNTAQSLSLVLRQPSLLVVGADRLAPGSHTAPARHRILGYTHHARLGSGGGRGW